MKEHPILFSAPMVRAILEGRKTQTRRIVSMSNAEFGSASREYWKHANFDQAYPEPHEKIDGVAFGAYMHVPSHRGDRESLLDLDRTWGARGEKHGYWEHYPDLGPCERCDEMGWRMTTHRLYPKWAIGDRLWVKETWQCYEWLSERKEGPVCYRSTHEGRCCKLPSHLWRPSIFMPRWASRILLEITNVRVERLNEISDEDAEAEGIKYLDDGPGAGFWIVDGTPVCATGSVEAYEQLWESINGPDSWAANPWVWVIEFRRIKP